MSLENEELQEETLEDYPPEPISDPSQANGTAPAAAAAASSLEAQDEEEQQQQQPPLKSPPINEDEFDEVLDTKQPANDSGTTTTSPPEGLREFGPFIWTVEGPVVDFLGYPYPTRMVVIKLSDDSSWIWSPTPFKEMLGLEIEEKVGPIKHLVSPNKLHHLWLQKWVDRYPDAKVYFPPGLKERNLETIQGIPTRGDDAPALLTNNPDPAYADDIDQLIFGGSFFMDEVVFFHKTSRTVIIADLIQRHDLTDVGTGWKSHVMKLVGIVGPQGGTPREWRMSFAFGKEKARQALAKITETWIPDRMVIAHGQCAEQDATKLVKEALKWVN